jgi:hypothetical protein
MSLTWVPVSSSPILQWPTIKPMYYLSVIASFFDQIDWKVDEIESEK